MIQRSTLAIVRAALALTVLVLGCWIYAELRTPASDALASPARRSSDAATRDEWSVAARAQPSYELVTPDPAVGDARSAVERRSPIAVESRGSQSKPFVAGRVSWPDGQPAWNAVIRVAPAVADVAIQVVVLGRSADYAYETDGSFHITVTGDGPFVVTAEARKLASASDEHRERLDERIDHDLGNQPRLETFDTGTDRPTWLACVRDVAAGTSGLELVLQNGSAVAGRVVDDLGRAQTRFRLDVYSRLLGARDPTWRARDRSVEVQSANGAFELTGLGNGDWWIWARVGAAEGIGPIVTLPGSNAELLIRVPRISTISGVVLDPEGRPAGEATIECWLDPLPPVSESARWSCAANAAGAFALELGTASKVTLRAAHPDWAASECRSQSIEPGTVVGDVELRLTRGGRVTGALRGMGGASNGFVGLHHSGPRGPIFLGAEVDSSGRFAIERVPAGDYELLAFEFENGEGSAPERDPSPGVRAKRRAARTLTVLEGQTTDLVVDLDR
jgi:hypothetical protein